MRRSSNILYNRPKLLGMGRLYAGIVMRVDFYTLEPNFAFFAKIQNFVEKILQPFKTWL